jgi:hypothetical protein
MIGGGVLKRPLFAAAAGDGDGAAGGGAVWQRHDSAGRARGPGGAASHGRCDTPFQSLTETCYGREMLRQPLPVYQREHAWGSGRGSPGGSAGTLAAGRPVAGPSNAVVDLTC